MTAAWTADQPIVKCTNVRKSYGPFEVLKGISLSVRKGEVICIIGPSGSGKSTLIRCINALVPITSGTIHVEGVDVTDPKLDKLALRRKVGMVFQQYNLFPHKTALQNVMMAPLHVLRQEKQAVEQRSRHRHDQHRDDRDDQSRDRHLRRRDRAPAGARCGHDPSTSSISDGSSSIASPSTLSAGPPR